MLALKPKLRRSNTERVWLDVIPDQLVRSLPEAIGILASMITPALLISACGTFILSTSNRLGRVVDRARVVSQNLEQLITDQAVQVQEDERREAMFAQLDKLRQRATMLVRSLTFFYMAAGAFIASSVAIGVLALYRRYAWIPLGLGLLGCLLLFVGSLILMWEARLAVNSLRGEMDFLHRLVNRGANRTRPVS